MPSGERADDRPVIVPSAGRDFRRMRGEQRRAGMSYVIGRGFCAARDALARGLIALRVTPNHLSAAGLLLTLVAAGALLRGAGQDWGQTPAGRWPAPVWAGVFLVLAAACDMLDGAVARLGRLGSAIGTVLDSTLDRAGDLVIYLAIAAHFAWRGNVTHAVLAVVALANSNLISYVKARAENLIPDCSVGYWLRGERFAALLIAAFSAHVPGVLWQQAISPAFTVLRRVRWTVLVLEARRTGHPDPQAGPSAGWRGWLHPWRFPRGSLPYDLVTGTNIAYIVFGQWLWPALDGRWDPLRSWLDAWTA